MQHIKNFGEKFHPPSPLMQRWRYEFTCTFGCVPVCNSAIFHLHGGSITGPCNAFTVRKKKQTRRDKFEYVRYAVIGHKFLVPAFRVVVACSKRSDSGERCKVKKAMKSRGGLGREVREPLLLPRFYFYALLFSSHRSPLSERLEQARVVESGAPYELKCSFCSQGRSTQQRFL